MKKFGIFCAVVAFCISVATPVVAYEVDLYPKEPHMYTFDNGITVEFPFSSVSSVLVLFAGYPDEAADNGIVYILEPADFQSAVGAMGYNLNEERAACSVDLVASGDVYVSVLFVKDGIAEFPGNESEFVRGLSEGELGTLRTLQSGIITGACSSRQGVYGKAIGFGDTYEGNIVSYAQLAIPFPSLDVEGSISPETDGPYYVGNQVQFVAEVTGGGNFEKTFTWSVDSAFSADTSIDQNGLLTIGSDETAPSVTVRAVATWDSAIYASYVLDITYPTSTVIVSPSGTITLPYWSKDRTQQYSLLLPDGEYFLADVEWSVVPSADAEAYFEISDTGVLTIKGGAPLGSVALIRWKYAFSDAYDTTDSYATIKITSTDEGIYDELDGFINGDHGFDSSGSDFSGAAGDLQNSSNQMNNAMSGGMNHLGAMMNSVDFTTTLTTLSSGFDALFVGHEVTICGVTANPFELVATIVAIAILLPLALKFIFRKWGSGSGGGSDA